MTWLQSHTLSFLQYSTGYASWHGVMWEETRQEHKYQEVGATGSRPGGSLPHVTHYGWYYIHGVEQKIKMQKDMFIIYEHLHS
jgi:hypothetical protein